MAPLKKAAPKKKNAAENAALLNAANPQMGKSREVGYSGTKISGGHIYEEYNPRLNTSQRFQTYEEMRRSDAQVAATLRVMELPIRATRWYVSPGKTTGPDGENTSTETDREIAAFVQDVLMNKMTPTWDDFLRQALTMLAFGFSLFEKVYAVEGDRVILRKLAQRSANSVFRWVWKQDGTPDVEQQITQSDAKVPSSIMLPGEKLVLFSYGREGDNYEGVSILRSAYKHWYMKDRLYKLSAVKHDRQAIGIPVITLPASHSPKDFEEAENILSNLRATEKNFVIKPTPEWQFEFAKIAGGDTATSTKEDIEHHNREIAKNVLAQFLELGAAGSGGSYSLSEDQSTIFTLSLTAIARQIADTLNRSVIPELVDANFNLPKGAVYPTLCFDKLGDVDISKLSAAIATLAGATVVTPDTDLEDHVRQIMNLPMRREEEQGTETEDMTDEEMPEDQADEMDAEAEDVAQSEDAAAEEAATENPEQDAADADAELAKLEEEVNKLQASEWVATVGTDLAQFSEAEAESFIFRLPVSEETKQKISDALKKWWDAHGRKSPEELAKQRSTGKTDADRASAGIAQRTADYKTAIAPLQEKLDKLKTEYEKIPYNKRTPNERKVIRQAQRALRAEIKKLKQSRDADTATLKQVKLAALSSYKAAKAEMQARSRAVESAIKKAKSDVDAKNATRSDAIRDLASKVRLNVSAIRNAYKTARGLTGSAKKEALKNARALADSVRNDNETLREAARKLRDEAKKAREDFLSKADAIRQAVGTSRKSQMSEEDVRSLGFADADDMRAFLDAKHLFDPAVILNVQRHG